MNDPLESDWRKFNARLGVWRERHLADRNRRIAAVLTEAGKTETERFWAAEKLIANEARALQRSLDDIRRSQMINRLLEMRLSGMIHREDLADFSPKLRDRVFFGGSGGKADGPR